MGLDIYHKKLTNHRPNKIGYSNDGIYLEDHFSEFVDTDWAIIKPFVKEIEYYTSVKLIYFSIIPNEIDFLSKELKGIQILSGESQAELNEKIKLFEEKNDLGKYFKEINISSPPWNHIKYYSKELRTGFYTETVGYQRKGMIDKFWRYFDYESEYHYYFQKEDFLNAYLCIGSYWESDTHEEIQVRKLKFEKDFIESFEEKKSFMFLSY